MFGHAPVNLPRADQADENRGLSLTAVSVSLTSIALLIVCLRVWARVRVLKSFGADDWVIIGTMMLSLVGMGLTLGQVANGAGRHAAYLPEKTVEIGLKLNYFGQILFLWAPCFVKLSIGLFLLRVTPVVVYRRIIYGTVIFLLAWTTACLMTLLLQCKNVAVIWNSAVETSCWSTEVIHALGWASAVVSIASDIFFAVLPIAMLRELQMGTKRKLSLGAVLSLGLFASAAAITKTVYIENYSSDTDNLWNATDLTIWTTVELNVGIIAASLPCLRPLLKVFSNNQEPTKLNLYKQYPMHPYTKTLNQDTGSRYLHTHTITHISGGNGELKDASSSEERMVLPTVHTSNSVIKTSLDE